MGTIRIEDIVRNRKIQCNYENRLKADMVAALTELQLEIDEHKMTNGVTNQGTWNECIACCSRVIQEKINSLKENSDVC